MKKIISIAVALASTLSSASAFAKLTNNSPIYADPRIPRPAIYGIKKTNNQPRAIDPAVRKNATYPSKKTNNQPVAIDPQVPSRATYPNKKTNNQPRAIDPNIPNAGLKVAPVRAEITSDTMGGSTSRLPFTCELNRAAAVKDYEQVSVTGFFNPGKSTVKALVSAQDKSGTRLYFGLAEVAFTNENGILKFKVPTELQQIIDVEISSELLSTVGNSFGQVRQPDLTSISTSVSCKRLSVLLKEPLDLSPEVFERFNLPTIPQSNPDVLIKEWASGNGAFDIVVVQYPDAVGSKYLPAIPSHTTIQLKLSGWLIDNDPSTDKPESIGYLMDGDKKIQAKFENEDAVNLKNIFGQSRSVLTLVTVNGSSQINLTVDCHSVFCTVTAEKRN